MSVISRIGFHLRVYSRGEAIVCLMFIVELEKEMAKTVLPVSCPVNKSDATTS